MLVGNANVAELPLNQYIQASAEVRQVDLLTSLGINAKNSLLTQLGSLSPDYADSSGLSFNGKASGTDDFGQVDYSLIGRTVSNPFRGYNDQTVSKVDSRAFDSTDILDLKPFDPTEIQNLTYGTTIDYADDDNNTIAAGFFRSGQFNQTGTILHGDGTLYLPSSNLTLGASEVVGNNTYGGSAPSNKYLTVPNPLNPAFPRSCNPFVPQGCIPTNASTGTCILSVSVQPCDPYVSHSANFVGGAEYQFGNASATVKQPFDLYTRYGSNGVGRDVLAVFSAADPGTGKRLNDAGATFTGSFLAGYRSIDYTYDPLLMPYNPMSGNQIIFSRASGTLTEPTLLDESTAACNHRYDSLPCVVTNEKPKTQTIAVSATRAANGSSPAYSAIGVSASMSLNNVFSLDAAFMRSTIAGSVVARESGKYVVLGTAASSLLDNDAIVYGITGSVPDIVSLTAGESFTHAAECVTVISCNSPYQRAVTFNAVITYKYLMGIGYSQPGSLQQGQSPGQSTASNQLVRNLEIAYHVCRKGRPFSYGFEPNITYTNRIPGTGSAFTPGNLFVEGVDIGPNSPNDLAISPHLAIPFAVRVEHQNAFTNAGLAVPLPTNAWSVTLIGTGQTLWQQHHSKGDLCVKSDANAM